MAALCTGNYGLTQNRTDESKEYFFVKLTDSAFRAVEEYQRNQNKYNTQATIKIIGNGGVLSFPTANGNVGQQFSFSIDEIEGSFECIRQTQNQLDVLGALPYKMRIHANDDVYETTRYRMAVAEENQKNKCTREIKPNQTDIGRKVKLKSSSNRLTNIPPKRDQILTNSSQSPLSSLSTVNPLLGGNTSTLSPISSNGTPSSSTLTTSSSNLPSSGSQNSNSIKNNANSVTANNNFNSHSSSKPHSNYNSTNSNSSTSAGVSAASSLSSVLSTAAGSGTSGINSGYYNNGSSTGGRSVNSLVSGTNSLSGSASRRGTTGVTGSNNRNQKNTSRHMPDITKRKIRERLIHLLALKPFKKPELYARLQNEGIRERERNLISGILKEISTMRDNTYNLKRQIWNDVNEDWPFYSEQELQMLKRRKPQNLTPPLSSDGGSSTSGQSPTSTHNGSPPPAVKRPSLDRDRFYEEPVAKKQRISHFRKEGNEINRRGGIADSRDSYNMNPRSRDYNHMRSSNYYGDLPTEPITNNWKHMPTPPQPSSNTVFNKHHQEAEENCLGLSYSVLGSEAARRISPRDEVVNGHGSVHNHHTSNNNSSSNKNNSSLGIKSNGNACQHSPSSYSSNNNSKINQSNDIRRQCSPVTTEPNINSDIGSTSPGALVRNCSPAIETAERERENIMNSISQNHDSHSSIGGPFTNNKYDFSRFTKIISIEQRRLYKTEFESDYTEYRDLLNKIERVGERFKVLAQRLNNARNSDDYRVIKRQILAEYDKINRDQEHQRVKARFDFLHAKLAHIKALVSEFDKTLTSTAASDSVSESFDNPVNRSRTSPSLGNGASINGNLSNGINSSINAASSLSLGPYSISSGSSSLNHLPKQENY